jgi:hypothetical protein
LDHFLEDFPLSSHACAARGFRRFHGGFPKSAASIHILQTDATIFCI